MTASADSEGSDVRRQRLNALVTSQQRAERVEAVLAKWLRQGHVGRVSAAGDARIAAIGAALALHDGDLLFGTARDLPAALARGVSVQTALRQALGAEGDPALGRALPGAVRDAKSRVTLSDSGPASHLVHAAGFGHAAQLLGGERIALALFGSGAQANGEVHAAFNFAALTHARVVFVARGPLAGELPLVEAAPAWGIHAVAVAGDDGLAVWDAVAAARARALAGDGPTLIDARLGGKPAVPRDVQRLQELGGWSGDARAEAVAALDEEVAHAQQAALAAPPVAASTLTQQLYGRGTG